MGKKAAGGKRDLKMIFEELDFNTLVFLKFLLKFYYGSF